MELKTCPFCGWAGVKIQKRGRGYRWLSSLVSEIRVDKTSYYVVCNRCKARGGVATGQIITYKRSFGDNNPFEEPAEDIPSPDWTTTEDELERKAIEAWNRRAE